MADATQQAVNWWTILIPVLLTIGGGTILGNILVAKYKEGIDRRHAIAVRTRDRHLEKADTLRRLIAAVVGARSAAGDARYSDLNKKSNLEEVALRSQANYERHVDNFARLSDEALLEAEKYGLIPDWCNLPDKHLSSYVSFVMDGSLGFTLDARSFEYGQAGDAYGHASALISDLRALVDAEEALASDVFVTKRKLKTFRPPSLTYLNELKVYFDRKEVDVKKLDMSVLENRLFEQERMEEEREKRKALFEANRLNSAVPQFESSASSQPNSIGQS
ncbi:MAG: hypothetical protein GC165_13090 [Armatimonadetes bacterium]|nr:hypothetical protein [Armatimonadota bacterium]